MHTYRRLARKDGTEYFSIGYWNYGTVGPSARLSAFWQEVDTERFEQEARQLVHFLNGGD